MRAKFVAQYGYRRRIGERPGRNGSARLIAALSNFKAR
jgi:hypothetical protein